MSDQTGQSGQSAIEDELKNLIVQTLMLKDVQPNEIDVDAPLFATGLGLDSIDALELAVEIGRRYKVQIKADDERNREIFKSVRSLAAFIEGERERAGGPR
jgi:acyl carrier protein